MHIKLKHPDLISIILLACSDKLHEVILAYRAVLDLKISYNATERIEHRVEYQGLERCLRVSHRSRYAVNYGFEYLRNTYACLAAGTNYLFMVTSKQIHNLILNLIRLGTVKIHLIYYRDYLKIIVNSHI